MTPRECQLKADHCERRSRQTSNDIDRRMLIIAAEYWRNLAKTAKGEWRYDDQEPTS